MEALVVVGVVEALEEVGVEDSEEEEVVVEVVDSEVSGTPYGETQWLRP